MSNPAWTSLDRAESADLTDDGCHTLPPLAVGTWALLRWSIGSGATLCHDLAFGLRVRWFPFPW